MQTIEPIAIVGIGVRLPGAVKSPQDLWELLVNGVDAITEVPEDRWHLSAMYHPDLSKPGRINTRFGAFLEHIDRFDAPFFGISPREAAAIDPQQRLLLEVSYQAVEDAGLTLAFLSGRNAGVYVGISSFDYAHIQLNERAGIDAYTNLGNSLSIAANRLSYFFNLAGPSLAIDTACSSSLVALDLACRSIWKGDIEFAFVAGVNVILRPETSIGFSKASMLAPDGRCKSFDAHANGYVRGEGAAVVILKPLARALAERDHIYSVIRGTAVNQDGRTKGISVPNQGAQEANLRSTLQLARIAPESVQYVEAHGTGTPVGDPIEAAALGAVYGKARPSGDRCVIGSIKSNLGHLEPASGLVGLIKGALCLQHRQIPASLHCAHPNPQIPFEALRLRVARRLEPWPQTPYGQLPRAAVNSFGFGGTNAHAILEAAPATERTSRAQHEAASGQAWMLPLSARSAQSLTELARSYMNALLDDRGLKTAILRDLCFSASVKRSHHEFRRAFVAHETAELAEQLQAFLREEGRAESSSDRKSEAQPGPVFVCTGMGQQWWAMGRELLAQEPTYRQAVERVDAVYARLAGWSLLREMTADEKVSRIQETCIAQPAIFALQVALAALWRSWGIQPIAVVGHSVGEAAASCISGALSLEDAAEVVFHRSRLQNRLAGRGAMLAVGISCADATHLVSHHGNEVSIAAVNGPRSVTLSGEAAALREIDQVLTSDGMFSRALQVEVPYHSSRMQEIESELVLSLRDVRPRPAATPLFSTVTGALIEGSELDAGYWYRNARQPVRFLDAMDAMIAAGYRLFLEIGAHPVLRHDIYECLMERAVRGVTLCSLRRQAGERAMLFGSLGQLFCLGADIDWPKLFPGDASPIKLPSYPFEGQGHWREGNEARRLRLGELIHPLLGDRIDAPQPIWKLELDTAGLRYLEDHRIGDSIVFPAAGYVEMALACARELFGPDPCVLEDVEFETLLELEQGAAYPVQVSFHAASSAFNVHVRPPSPNKSWHRYACGFVRKAHGRMPAHVDVELIRRRCLDHLDQDEFYSLCAPRGYYYGPSFRGIVDAWRGEREFLVEIRAPGQLSEQISEYRLHPAILDACLQPLVATLPAAVSGEMFLPRKIERLKLHALPPPRIFAHVKLREIKAAEIVADIQIFEPTGDRLVDVQGLVCRSVGRAAQLANAPVLYEYQWKLTPRLATGRTRCARHLPSPQTLAPFLQGVAETLWRRLERRRFQDEFQPRAGAVALAYIGAALRELGWASGSCTAGAASALGDRLGVATHHHRLLALLVKQAHANAIAATDDPRRLWKRLWDDFPECHAELSLIRRCGERLAAVLRGEVDPLDIIFLQGALTGAEQFYQNSETFRLSNLMVQRAIAEIVSRLPRGKALRILEIGGGTGGMTSYLLPVLSEHCAEYVFTDISLRFTAHAEQKFAEHPFIRCRPLDIELDPVAQGFAANSFDIIIASDVLHATRDLRNTLAQIKCLIASCGTLVLLEEARAGLHFTLIFGLLKGWWLFEDHDLRPDGPCLPPQEWERLLHAVGFSDTASFGDCPELDRASHALILARGPLLADTSIIPAPALAEPRAWLVFLDKGICGRAGVGAELVRQLQQRGDQVIEASLAAQYRQVGIASFEIDIHQPNDMRCLLETVSGRVPRLAGVVHLCSLDIESSEGLTRAALHSSARLGCVGVLRLVQAIAVTANLTVDSLWLITRSVHRIGNRAEAPQLMQSPLWGLGRVAGNEYSNLACRMVDLATCSQEEIALLADEMNTEDHAEDEIALHGELRYVHRLIPVAAGTLHGIGRHGLVAPQSFRIELKRPGILESLTARSLQRVPPGPREIEIEVTATGLNFKDLMLATGMLPKEAVEDDAFGDLMGLECAGRVVAIGQAVTKFKAGDQVVAVGAGHFATHITVDVRRAARAPRHLRLEQAATIPTAFVTAFYSLHTLGQMQRGERVLIHAATGGVGMAAVQLALKAGAVVFATAGSPEKRELLEALGVPHVMDSRSLAFADEVMELTAGEGVDLVLNSLAGEAIDKSISVLKSSGRFIEIGKTDIYKNRMIGMRALRKNISFFTVDISSLAAERPELAHALLSQVLERFAPDDLQPLPHHAFPVTCTADAFRYMAQAKHVGKLIVAMQDFAGLYVEQPPPTATIDSNASYLICGGLGGFGLAAAERLVRRGARHLALIGRSASSPSARAAVDALRQSGAQVMTYQADIAEREQVREVVAETQRAMGPLRGIVHAAMVLDDAPIEHLSEERMWKALAPKMAGAWNLHTLTAELPIDFFILFSSMASVFGSQGQANYNAGNAFLDALAYYRRSRGLPALTVNWGVVGDVGHVASSAETSTRLTRLGMRAVPVSGMLDALDELMCSDAVQIAVAQLDWKDLLRAMGSRVPARFADLAGGTNAAEGVAGAISYARAILEADSTTRSTLLETYIRHHVAHAMGAAPANIDTQRSLLNLGLDSLIAVNVRNRIKADFGVNVSLTTFMQGASIKALAAYLAEWLQERDCAKQPDWSDSRQAEAPALPQQQPLTRNNADATRL
jgi:acyl transferase domain-containing protein/short-subunit dehydrogenase/acyl carrier protein